MSHPYIAQDEGGGWYGDVDGVMQDPDPTRTREQALDWAFNRLVAAAEEYDAIITTACQVCGKEIVVRRERGL
jgi:hypothetical protein